MRAFGRSCNKADWLFGKTRKKKHQMTKCVKNLIGPKAHISSIIFYRYIPSHIQAYLKEIVKGTIGAHRKSKASSPKQYGIQFTTYTSPMRDIIISHFKLPMFLSKWYGSSTTLLGLALILFVTPQWRPNPHQGPYSKRLANSLFRAH